MKLVIAEKPSVAMALASVLGARTRKDGYVEGNGYIVSWCVGHLVGLCDASEYDEKYKKWRYEDLPIVPECWKHKILEGTKKQFGILKKLMRDSKVDEVICATDAGREGELIFRLVYEQAGCKKPMKRLWISSMEEQAIKDGFASLKDGSCYDSLYQSALCRAKADWLVGINASRLFSVLYNQNLKVGRVQTPTLAMIVDRNQKIKEFTKEKYYMAHIKFDDMDAVTEHFQKKEDADKVAEDCLERMCEVEKDDVKEKTVRPPKLYDLTTLQREANRMFGYTAQQTLDAVQEMYEQKLVTYPRTDSQYLTDEMGESTETLIQMLLGKMPYAKGLEYQPDVSKVLNSKKVSDHHAIIPTVEVAKADIGKLKERNCKILYLISARVLIATADPYIYESHKCQITCNYHTFYLSAKKTKQEGFKAIENKLKQFFGVKIEKEELELDIWDGKHYGPCDSFVSEHFTQPPKQYTEDTLLSAMERAGNEELTEDTEKKGLGTPATRAAIIEKLIQSGFVKREKKNLVPTDDGNLLITVEKGINVIQEHPIDIDDYIMCIKIAQKNCCMYRLNTFYPHLSNVKQFIFLAGKLRKKNDVQYINAECSVHVLFPLIDILGRAIGGLRPWKFERVEETYKNSPFCIIYGSIYNIPICINVQNQMDPSDPENSVLLFHKISLYTECGNLTMIGTNSDIMWEPRIRKYIAADGGFHLEADDEYLDLPVYEEMHNDEGKCFREMFSDTWPDSIKLFLEDFYRDFYLGKKMDSNAQFLISVCQAWKDLGNSIGSANIIHAYTTKPIKISEIVK